jgi:hypothetical protein
VRSVDTDCVHAIPHHRDSDTPATKPTAGRRASTRGRIPNGVRQVLARAMTVPVRGLAQAA